MEKDNILILCIILIFCVVAVCGIVLTQNNTNSNNTVINTTNTTVNTTTNNTTANVNTNTQTVSSHKSSVNSNSGSSQSSNLVKDENSEVYGKLSYDSDGNEYWTGQGDDGGVYTSRNGATSDGGYNHDGVHYDSSGSPTCSADGIY